MWSVQDILKNSPKKALPTPPPSPVEHPSRIGRRQSWIPGITPIRRPHPYSRSTAISLPHPNCVQPLSLEELKYPDSTAVVSPQSLPATPKQPLEELPQNSLSTSTTVAHKQRFGKPSHRNDLNELCKLYIPPTTKSNTVTPGQPVYLCLG